MWIFSQEILKRRSWIEEADFFILKLQLGLSRLRWKQWEAFYLHLGPEAQASSLFICPYDWRFKAWESPLDPSLIWTTYLFPKENCPVFPISLYGFLQNAALLCCSRNVTGFVAMCYSSDFCSCKHIVKSKRYFIFFYTWKKRSLKIQSPTHWRSNFPVSVFVSMLGIIYWRISLFLWCNNSWFGLPTSSVAYILLPDNLKAQLQLYYPPD